jgi:hypothetical protein
MCEKLGGTRSYDPYFKIMVNTRAEQTNNCEAAGKHSVSQKFIQRWKQQKLSSPKFYMKTVCMDSKTE